VDPTDGLDGYRKARPPQGFDSRTVQSTVNRYNDYGIPGHSKSIIILIII
jgi:hypothetical protein